VLVDVDAPWSDTRARDLSWALGLRPLEALASRAVTLPSRRCSGVELDLRLLGSSHQVLLRAGDTRLSEVVACLSGAAPGLPGQASEDLAGATYDFAAGVRTLDEASLPRFLRRLRRRVERSPYALFGTFPGSPWAVTALVARSEADGVSWRTWHAYPQTGEVAATRTAVVLT
jgi:hypothetical protein